MLLYKILGLGGKTSLSDLFVDRDTSLHFSTRGKKGRETAAAAAAGADKKCCRF